MGYSEDTEAINPTGVLPSWAENFATASDRIVCDAYSIELRVLGSKIKYAIIFGSLNDVSEMTRLLGAPFFGTLLLGWAAKGQ